MPDDFNNARPFYDVTFPNSGDGFSISGTKNALQGLGFMDMIPLQPRAHNPADLSIMVRGRDASSFYNPVYYGDGNQRVPFESGDSAAMVAPVSNQRIDIVYLTPSGDLGIEKGTEAATPDLPSLAPSGDSRTPICAITHKVGETRIVNFEDKDSNSGDGFISQDLRPWLRTAGAGSAVLTATTPVGVTGDNAAGIVLEAARADHTHEGVHAIRKVGSVNLLGDVEFAGPITQAGNRITIDEATKAQMEAASADNVFISPASAKGHPGVAKAWSFFVGTGTPAHTVRYNFDSTITDNNTGNYTLGITEVFSSGNYVPVVTPAPSSTDTFVPTQLTLAAGTLQIIIKNSQNGGAIDSDQMFVAIYGDQ